MDLVAKIGYKILGFTMFKQIREYIGHPFEDKYTKEKTMLKYARMLVEVHIDGPFTEYIKFSNEKDILLRQKVHYECLPITCTYCKMFGHTQELYKTKDTSRKEWRVKTHMHTPAPARQPEQQATNGTEGFQLVQKHSAKGAKSTIEQRVEATPVANSFNILLEEEIMHNDPKGGRVGEAASSYG